MKRIVGILVAFVVLIAGFVMMYSKLTAKVTEAEKEANLLRIQRDYLEKVGWLRANPDEKAYKDEVNGLFRQYFKQTDEHVEKYGGSKDYDEYLGELDKAEARAKEPKKGAAGPGEKKARYDFVRRVFDQMHGGKYAPVWSATDKGMRFDILTADVKMSEGAPVVRMETALWGEQRDLKDEGKTKRMVASASYGIKFKLTDAKDKLLGEMSGNDPSMKTDWPERLIWSFPPQMVLGYYEMPMVPAEVAKAEITFTVSSRASTGGDAAATYVWKLDPIPAEWKLRPGEKWEGAEEAVRPAEEIDPAAAAAQAKRKR